MDLNKYLPILWLWHICRGELQTVKTALVCLPLLLRHLQACAVRELWTWL